MKKLLLSDPHHILGLCTSRCNIRQIHGETENIDKDGFDLNQESALLPCTLVKIQNKWDNYYYIKSQVGSGWVPKDAIAIITHSQAEEFLFPEKFCIITEPVTRLCGTDYYMSCKIPLRDGILQLPFNDNGTVYFKSCPQKEGCHFGYLSFSRNAVISQAIKFLDFAYDWGEKNGGLDCSSLIMYSFAVCGITLPRSSAGQSKVTFPVSSFPKEDYRKAMPGDIIYMPGHVMLSLGGKYILHASASAGKVCIGEL